MDKLNIIDNYIIKVNNNEQIETPIKNTIDNNISINIDYNIKDKKKKRSKINISKYKTRSSSKN